MYKGTYEYVVDGEYYYCTSSVSSSSYPSSSKTILFDSTNPSKCKVQATGFESVFIYIFLIIPLVFGLIGIIGISFSLKKKNKLKYLEQNGKLIRGIPFELVPSNVSVNGRRLDKPQIDYTLPNGNIIKLTGNPIYKNKVLEEYNTVDLLIDENDSENYFIDFHIDEY